MASEIKIDGELSGGSVDYYKVRIERPTTFAEPYMAECNDIIEALDMTFAEGNVFKAVWRIAAARIGKKKRGQTSVYDAEKVEFFARRMKIKEETDARSNATK